MQLSRVQAAMLEALGFVFAGSAEDGLSQGSKFFQCLSLIVLGNCSEADAGEKGIFAMFIVCELLSGRGEVP